MGEDEELVPQSQRVPEGQWRKTKALFLSKTIGQGD